jgi:hypothetical protein
VDGGTVWIESEPFDSTDSQAKSTQRSYAVVEDMKWDRLLTQDEVMNIADVGASHEELTAALSTQSEFQVSHVVAMMRSNDEAVKKCEVTFII